MSLIMPIPQHEPCSAAEMARFIENYLADRTETGYRFFNFEEPAAALAGDRLTRVPFLKLCLRGKFHVIPSTGGEEEDIEAGTIVLFAPNSFVNVQYREPCEILRITFDADGMLVGCENVEALAPQRPNLPTGKLRATWFADTLARPASRLLEELLRRGFSEPVRRNVDTARTLLWEIAAQLKRAERNPVPNIGNSRQDQVLRFIQDQCQRPVTRESVAAALGMSPGHLGRIVKAATGKSFNRYMTESRLDQARWLLRNSRLSIEEIALRSGFTGGNYFAQAFRRAEGIAPLAWRKKNG